MANLDIGSKGLGSLKGLELLKGLGLGKDSSHPPEIFRSQNVTEIFTYSNSNSTAKLTRLQAETTYKNFAATSNSCLY